MSSSATPTMRAYWQEAVSEVPRTEPLRLSLAEALDRWSDLRGVEGNFFGLIDNQDRIIQFYFQSSIPDSVEDASHLGIVVLDIPVPEMQGSLSRLCNLREASRLIEQAFAVGANPDMFEGLVFARWS